MSNFFKKLICFKRSEQKLSKAKYKEIIDKLCLNYDNLKEFYFEILEKCSLEKNNDEDGNDDEEISFLKFEEFKSIYPELRNQEKYKNDCVLYRIFKGIYYNALNLNKYFLLKLFKHSIKIMMEIKLYLMTFLKRISSRPTGIWDKN
jgi:hypothetical protein